jgi:hypothetical protein
MSSSAISSQNFVTRVSTATAAAKTITGATAANPVQITSTAHGLAAGTVIVITGVVGMVELNNRAFVLSNPLTNTFELKGVDGTLYTAYGSGGSATPQTMTAVSNVKDVSLFDGTTQEIDTTNLQSLAKEYVLDIPDRGAGSLTIDLDVTDAGQARLKALHILTTAVAFTSTDRNGKAAAFMAYVQSFPVSAGVGRSVGGQVALRITGLEAWFA